MRRRIGPADGGLITHVNEDGCRFAYMITTKEGVETWRRKALDATRSWRIRNGGLLLDGDQVPARFEKAGS